MGPLIFLTDGVPQQPPSPNQGGPKPLARAVCARACGGSQPGGSQPTAAAPLRSVLYTGGAVITWAGTRAGVSPPPRSPGPAPRSQRPAARRLAPIPAPASAPAPRRVRPARVVRPGGGTIALVRRAPRPMRRPDPPPRASALATGTMPWPVQPRRLHPGHPGAMHPAPPRTAPPRPAPRRRSRPSLEASKAAPVDGPTCLAALRRLGVPFRVAPPARGMRTPVVVTGPLHGVTLTPQWGKRPALMDCRFAWVLHQLAPVVRAAGFDELRYSSFYMYRNVARSHRLSRHANGLAVDIHELRGPGGLRAHVQRHWQRTGGAASACRAPFPPTPAGRMRQVVCGIEASGLVYLVLTPDSDADHYNHLHVSGLRSGDHPLRGRVAGVRVKGR